MRKKLKDVEAAQKSKAKAMVCFNYRFVPALRLAKEFISSGKLGRYITSGRSIFKSGLWTLIFPRSGDWIKMLQVQELWEIWELIS